MVKRLDNFLRSVDRFFFLRTFSKTPTNTKYLCIASKHTKLNTLNLIVNIVSLSHIVVQQKIPSKNWRNNCYFPWYCQGYCHGLLSLLYFVYPIFNATGWLFICILKKLNSWNYWMLYTFSSPFMTMFLFACLFQWKMFKEILAGEVHKTIC